MGSGGHLAGEDVALNRAPTSSVSHGAKAQVAYGCSRDRTVELDVDLEKRKAGAPRQGRPMSLNSRTASAYIHAGNTIAWDSETINTADDHPRGDMTSECSCCGSGGELAESINAPNGQMRSHPRLGNVGFWHCGKTTVVSTRRSQRAWRPAASGAAVLGWRSDSPAGHPCGCRCGARLRRRVWRATLGLFSRSPFAAVRSPLVRTCTPALHRVRGHPVRQRSNVPTTAALRRVLRRTLGRRHMSSIKRIGELQRIAAETAPDGRNLWSCSGRSC